MKSTMAGWVVAAAVALASPAALAGEMLTGDEIRETVADHTISGTMLETGPYAEFYQADGTILGEGYTGAWTIEGDTMCFAYGGEPSGCWHVGMSDGTVQWYWDGEVLGDGTAAAGNINGF